MAVIKELEKKNPNMIAGKSGLKGSWLSLSENNRKVNEINIAAAAYVPACLLVPTSPNNSNSLTQTGTKRVHYSLDSSKC